MPIHYGTVLGASAYHAARGNAAWAATGGEYAKEASLLRASDWVDNTYRDRFSGWKFVGRSQDREWPRAGAVDASGHTLSDDEVPAEMEAAVYEAALRELLQPGSLAPDFEGAKQVKSERKKIGLIEKETEYVEGTAATSRPVFAIIDGILAGLLTPARGNTSVTFLCRV